MIGKVDLIRERDGRLELVEFKYRKNSAPSLGDSADRQLNHYRLAFTGADPLLVVHYLKDRETRIVEARAEGVVRAEIRATAEKIRRAEFPAKPERGRCTLCLVKDACSQADPGASNVASLPRRRKAA